MHWLKGRRERADKLLELRTKVYTEYFKKYELAAQQVDQDYEHFSLVPLREELEKYLNADNEAKALLEFRDAVGDYPNKIMSAHRKVTEELTTLKILGSSKLLKLTEEFEAINQQMLDRTPKWLKEIDLSSLQGRTEFPVAAELTALGQKAKALKEEIIKQMRIELGHDY